MTTPTSADTAIDLPFAAGPGATILGRITIGHHAVIGGNVWLTESVPPRGSITQARMRSAERVLSGVPT